MEAELRRKTEAGVNVPWTLRDPVEGDGGLPTDPVSDAVARERLQSIITILGATSSVSDTVAQERLQGIIDVLEATPAVETGLAKEVTLQDIRDGMAAPGLFERIKNKRFLDTEEVRYDFPGTDIYVGVAPDGSATDATVWAVVRTYLDATGSPVRDRIRIGVSWDDRAAGW